MSKGLLIKGWISEVCSKPLEVIIGLSVLATAAAGGAISHVASTSVGLLFIVSLVYIRSWPALWRQLTAGEQLVLLGFCLYFFSAVLSYYNVNDEHVYMRHLDRYLRFLLIVPIYLLLAKAGFKLFPYLLAGAIISGPLYLSSALLSITEQVGSNAKGSYHHITFGDMAMLSALFMASVLVVKDLSNAVKIILVISILCLLYASILSQARGAWLALPFGALLLMVVAIKYGRIKIRTIAFALVVILTLIVLSPAKDILSGRILKAVHEIELFQSGEVAYSSVGSRLAMWHVATNVWKKFPILGTGPGDFREEFIASQEQGLYTDVGLYASTHNIFFQALSTTGTIGFIILCAALFILPFRLFYRQYKRKMCVASVSGMVMLTSFAVFGLTESWTLRSPAISVYLLYFVTLATAISQETDADKSMVL